jgi:hypothetical protein
MVIFAIAGCQFFQKNNTQSVVENPAEQAIEQQEDVIINEPPVSTVSGFGCVRKTDYNADSSMFGHAQTYFSGVLFSYLNIYECQQDETQPVYTVELPEEEEDMRDYGDAAMQYDLP